MSELALFRKNVRSCLSELSHYDKLIREEESSLKEARERVEHLSQAQSLVQSVAEGIQQVAHQQIASTVSRCLKAVFRESACELRINFRKSRGRTEAELVFFKDGHELDPLEAEAGGMVDVASLGLRLSCLVLARPLKRKLLVCDEPFKYINGKVYQSRVGSLLEKLSREFSIQIILVSDDDWLKLGKVVDLNDE